MFHYLNYYHLTQRWTQPRTPPESHQWVEREGERMEEVGGGAVKETVLYGTKKVRYRKQGDREGGWRDGNKEVIERNYQ